MKLCNVIVGEETHLAVVTPRGVVDAAAAGCRLTMDEVIRGADRSALATIAGDERAPVLSQPRFGNVVDTAGKLLCVGRNYAAHAVFANHDIPSSPMLFCKFSDSLAAEGAEVELPPWETGFDAEAELVVVIGKTAWNVSQDEAGDYIFGYTCGNDLSCRPAQRYSSQWLIGKTMPAFGPAGPWIVTADEFDPEAGVDVRGYVNGELRQEGNTRDMMFSCRYIVSYASRFLRLQPGDLIFTGTPAGTAMERKEERFFLHPGDTTAVEIQGIGTLHNVMR
ncbi:MAG: fumarylacetoacetate hydrolase family protein [Oscillospiraceae bacterium]|nr:fumarylacetoacetate hydrolase family protein [Oscillospiraceae bacterium]